MQAANDEERVVGQRDVPFPLLAAKHPLYIYSDLFPGWQVNK